MTVETSTAAALSLADRLGRAILDSQRIILNAARTLMTQFMQDPQPSMETMMARVQTTVMSTMPLLVATFSSVWPTSASPDVPLEGQPVVGTATTTTTTASTAQTMTGLLNQTASLPLGTSATAPVQALGGNRLGQSSQSGLLASVRG